VAVVVDGGRLGLRGCGAAAPNCKGSRPTRGVGTGCRGVSPGIPCSSVGAC